MSLPYIDQIRELHDYAVASVKEGRSDDVGCVIAGLAGPLSLLNPPHDLDLSGFRDGIFVIQPGYDSRRYRVTVEALDQA